jgi:hypothetical protein
MEQVRCSKPTAGRRLRAQAEHVATEVRTRRVPRRYLGPEEALLLEAQMLGAAPADGDARPLPARKWSAEPLQKQENNAVARFPKPSAGLEPATPSLPSTRGVFRTGAGCGESPAYPMFQPLRAESLLPDVAVRCFLAASSAPRDASAATRGACRRSGHGRPRVSRVASEDNERPDHVERHPVAINPSQQEPCSHASVATQRKARPWCLNRARCNDRARRSTDRHEHSRSHPPDCPA